MPRWALDHCSYQLSVHSYQGVWNEALMGLSVDH